MMASAKVAVLEKACLFQSARHQFPPGKCAKGGVRVCSVRSAVLHLGTEATMGSHASAGEQPLPSHDVDWRQAAASRQPGQRRQVELPASSEPPSDMPSRSPALQGCEQDTLAAYVGWVRRGEHRDSVWKDGTVRLGDQLVRIRKGRVSVISPPSQKVQALAAAAAPATQSSVQARARRQKASTARLRELLGEKTREYERSAERAAHRDAQDQSSTASHLHLLLACYDRLTLPAGEEIQPQGAGEGDRDGAGASTRVSDYWASELATAYHALREVRDQLQARLQRSLSDEEWTEAAELSSISELHQRVEQGVAAKCRLVEGNLRLVVSIALNFRNMGLDLEDLIQAGIVGLLKGVDRYDVRRGFRFSTYATYWIRQSIQHTIRQESRLVRLPAYAWDRLSKIAKARARLLVRLGRPASLEETAAEVRLSPGAVRTLLAASQDVLSLEGSGPALLQRSLASGERVADWAERLADPDCDKDPYEMLAQEGAPHDIERLLCKLEEEEARVLELRLGLRGQPVHNLVQTSKRASVPFAKVAKLQNAAIDKLRGPFKKDVEDLLAV